MAETTSVELHRSIAVPAALVYRAFTGANAWQEWLCTVAEAAPNPQGQLYWYWQAENYYACGHYLTLSPNEGVTFTWQGKGDAVVTEVHVALAAGDGSTEVTLTHSGIPAGAAGKQLYQEIRKGWETGLENLQSVLETGIDLRVARVPFMGIVPSGANTPELAASLGIPVTYGIQISGTVAGTGAEAAGLQKDDVLVELAGHKLENFNSLAPVLRTLKAGDGAPLSFYRGPQQHTVTLTLSSRPRPQVPETAAALADRLTEMYAELDQELEAALQDVSEAHAAHRPTETEWSVKEVLAHLICVERDTQNWAACEMADFARPGFTSNEMARVRATTAIYQTVADLLTALKKAETETVAMAAMLPDEFVARKSAYLRIGQGMLFAPFHNHTHLDQIRAALAAAAAAELELVPA